MRRDEEYGNLMHQVHVVCEELSQVNEDGLVGMRRLYEEMYAHGLKMEEELFLRVVEDLCISELVEHAGRGFLAVLVAPVAGIRYVTGGYA